MWKQKKNRIELLNRKWEKFCDWLNVSGAGKIEPKREEGALRQYSKDVGSIIWKKRKNEWNSARTRNRALKGRRRKEEERKEEEREKEEIERKKGIVGQLKENEIGG